MYCKEQSRVVHTMICLSAIVTSKHKGIGLITFKTEILCKWYMSCSRREQHVNSSLVYQVHCYCICINKCHLLITIIPQKQICNVGYNILFSCEWICATNL